MLVSAVLIACTIVITLNIRQLVLALIAISHTLLIINNNLARIKGRDNDTKEDPQNRQ